MPQVEIAKSVSEHKARRIAVAAVVVATLVIVAGAAAAWFYYHKPAEVKANNGTTPAHMIGDIYVPAIADDSAAIAKMKQDDYTQQSPQLLIIAKSGDAAKRAEAYRQLAMLALNADKPDEALSYAKQGEEIGQSHVSASTVALVAEKSGNYKLAVEYYNRAMARTANNADPKISALYENYKALRDAAEKQ